MPMMRKRFNDLIISQRSPTNRQARKNQALVSKPTKSWQMLQARKDNKKNQILLNNPDLRYHPEAEKIINEMIIKNR